MQISSFALSENLLLKFELRPGAGGINSAGFHDREFAVGRRPGVRRIIALGDSITSALSRRIEETYASRLESMLNQAADRQRFEVYNLGVGGYDTLQEAELLRTRIERYPAEIVTVGFCINDFWTSDGGLYERLRAEGDSFDSVDRMLAGITRASRLGLFVRYHATRLFKTDTGSRATGPVESRDGRLTLNHAGLMLTGDSTVDLGLQVLAGLQRRFGFQLVVFVIPAFDRRFSEYLYRQIHERVGATAARYPGVRLVDLLPRFARVNDDPSGLSADGLHLNATGHRQLAMLIAESLREVELRQEVSADDTAKEDVGGSVEVRH